MATNAGAAEAQTPLPHSEQQQQQPSAQPISYAASAKKATYSALPTESAELILLQCTIDAPHLATYCTEFATFTGPMVHATEAAAVPSLLETNDVVIIESQLPFQDDKSFMRGERVSIKNAAKVAEVTVLLVKGILAIGDQRARPLIIFFRNKTNRPTEKPNIHIVKENTCQQQCAGIKGPQPNITAANILLIERNSPHLDKVQHLPLMRGSNYLPFLQYIDVHQTFQSMGSHVKLEWLVTSKHQEYMGTVIFTEKTELEVRGQVCRWLWQKGIKAVFCGTILRFIGTEKFNKETGAKLQSELKEVHGCVKGLMFDSFTLKREGGSPSGKTPEKVFMFIQPQGIMTLCEGIAKKVAELVATDYGVAIKALEVKPTSIKFEIPYSIAQHLHEIQVEGSYVLQVPYIRNMKKADPAATLLSLKERAKKIYDEQMEQAKMEQAKTTETATEMFRRTAAAPVAQAPAHPNSTPPLAQPQQPVPPTQDLWVNIEAACLQPYHYSPEAGVMAVNNCGEKLEEELQKCLKARSNYIIETHGQKKISKEGTKHMAQCEKHLRELVFAAKATNKILPWVLLEKVILPVESDAQKNEVALTVNKFLLRLKSFATANPAPAKV